LVRLAALAEDRDELVEEMSTSSSSYPADSLVVLNLAFSIRPIKPEVLASSVIAGPGPVMSAAGAGEMTRAQNRHHGTPFLRRDTIPGTARDARAAM
jgi:hypothetical protein